MHRTLLSLLVLTGNVFIDATDHPPMVLHIYIHLFLIERSKLLESKSWVNAMSSIDHVTHVFCFDRFNASHHLFATNLLQPDLDLQDCPSNPSFISSTPK